MTHKMTYAADTRSQLMHRRAQRRDL